MLAEAEKDSRVADMNRMLAFRTLKQTSIDNAGDLRFLIQLFIRQGQAKEALAYFETLKTQDSAVAKQAFDDWQFARQRIELCAAEAKWDDLMVLCRSLLGLDGEHESEDGSAGGKLIVKDDWKVWSGLVRAHENLGKLQDFPVYRDGSQETWKEKRQHMIATLWVTLLIELGGTGKNATEAASITKTVQLAKDYFAMWRTYPFCFDDIKDYIVQLPLAAQNEICQEFSIPSLERTEIGTKGEEAHSKKQSEWLTAEMNCLRFEYLLNPGISAKPQVDILRAFACKAIRLVETCHRIKQPTADATYLAVSALIRLYKLEKDVTSLFQAAYLLESGPAPEDAHPGKVMLVYINSEIGLLSKSLQEYKSLRVREIQYETMAHMQLSRISISHPFAVEQRRQESIDPSRIIDEGLDVFVSSDQKLASAQVKLLEQGKCDLIFELQELRDSLAHSMNRRILILEQARIARLTDDPQHDRVFDIRPRVIEHWTQDIKDNRDYAETFNYDGVTKETYPERSLQAGGRLIGSKWLLTSILACDTWSLLSNRETICLTPSTPISPGDTDTSELTDMEIALLDPWNTLLLATQTLLSTSPSDKPLLQPRVERLQETLSSLPLSKLSDTEPTTSEGQLLLPAGTPHLQSHFLLLDFLRTTALFTTTAGQISSKRRAGQMIPGAPLAGLKTAVKKAYESVRASAEKAKNRVDAGEIARAMREGEVGIAIEEAENVGRGVRAWAEGAEVSAREAWEGVLKVRLGIA